jgi:hypothetical protein
MTITEQGAEGDAINRAPSSDVRQTILAVS